MRRFLSLRAALHVSHYNACMLSQLSPLRTISSQMVGSSAHASRPQELFPTKRELTSIFRLSAAAARGGGSGHNLFLAAVCGAVSLLDNRLVTGEEFDKVESIQEPAFSVGKPMKKLYISSESSPSRHSSRRALYQGSSQRICCVSSTKKLIESLQSVQNISKIDH